MERKARAKANGTKGSMRRKYAAVIGIVVVIVVIAGATVYGLSSAKATSFGTFKGNFDSAPRVAIYATGYNGTALSATIGCATAVIESVVGSPTSHRNASTIDLFVLNQTSCAYENGIGGTITNYTFNSISNCVRTSSSEPSIFINYSSVNVTIVKPTSLHIYGNSEFLALCGVASEIT